MTTTLVTVDHTAGRLFEGTAPGTFCFVPLTFLVEEGGALRVREIDYVCARWDVRNMRANAASADGEHLFPNTERPIDDLIGAGVPDFIRRLRREQSATATPVGADAKR